MSDELVHPPSDIEGKMEEIVSDTGTDSEQVGSTFGSAASGCDLSNEIKKR